VRSVAHRVERFNASWSPQQDRALALVRDWLRARDRPVFRLFGYAGTGKTELAREIGANAAGTTFAAFTGKAAHVMRQGGCAPCSTIHRLIYDARYDEQRRRYRYQLKSKAALSDIKLIIVDECSMVNDVLAKDLLSFGIPVLPIGDPAQLPPVKGASYFMAGAPDVMLTEIHRQALENPILRLANQIRAGGRLPPAGYRAGDALRISQDAEPLACFGTTEQPPVHGLGLQLFDYGYALADVAQWIVGHDLFGRRAGSAARFFR
jgi:exodeoxyribonuclease-5